MRRVFVAFLIFPAAALAQTATDTWGRSITCTGAALLTCTSSDGVSVQAGSVDQALGTFNAMAPSSYVAPLIPQTSAQKAAALQAQGLTIVSTGTPALNAVYALDQTTLGLLTSEQLYAVANGTFSNGESTITWLYSTPPVTFPSISAFKSVASTIAQTITALSYYGAGVTQTPPSMAVTIP